MYKIKIIAVGKIKEKYLKDAILEYTKRLSAYSDLKICEVNDENAFDESAGNILRATEKEGEKILSMISEKEFVILLDVKGRELSSEDFSEKLRQESCINAKELCFIIGGSYGVSEMVRQRADFKLSFSPMTFPHQLMRVILLEQIYRCFKIINKEKYHKWD